MSLDPREKLFARARPGGNRKNQPLGSLYGYGKLETVEHQKRFHRCVELEHLSQSEVTHLRQAAVELAVFLQNAPGSPLEVIVRLREEVTNGSGKRRREMKTTTANRPKWPYQFRRFQP